MNKLSNARTTLDVVSRHGFDFRKRFGQNVLVDEGVILRSLEAAQVGKNDVIFEIGPGIGTLTQYLSEAAQNSGRSRRGRSMRPSRLTNTCSERAWQISSSESSLRMS